MSSTASAIPPGSLILVTGATGYLGGHIADELWRQGYRLRIVVRSAEKAKPIEQYVEEKYGAGRYEHVLIEDFTKPGVFDDAVKGVSAIAHVAMSVDPPSAPTYEEAMQPAVEGAMSLLRSAHEHGGPELKRVVLTSSARAAHLALEEPGTYQWVDDKSWNTLAAELAKKDLEAKGGWARYAATKYESEKAAWNFMQEKKPTFELNTTLPDGNYGPDLPFMTTHGSTGYWIKMIARGDTSKIKTVFPHWFIDVRDTAIIHRIALTEPTVANERLWLATQPFTWNTIIHLVKRLRPESTAEYFGADLDRYDHTFIDNRRARELIVKYGGRSALRTIDETLQDALA